MQPQPGPLRLNSIPRKLSRRSRVGVAGTRDQATVLHWLLSSLDSRRSNQRYASAPMMSLAVRRGGPAGGTSGKSAHNSPSLPLHKNWNRSEEHTSELQSPCNLV